MNFAWLFKMAWRDSRRGRARLLLFVSSIVTGVAAITAVQSFSENLRKDVDRESKSLLGADLLIEGNTPVPDSISLIINELAPKKARVHNLINMAFFPKNEGTRLALVRAVEPNYPFFGTVKTEPQQAFETFRNGKKALVDHALMLQFDLKVGDSIRLGEADFRIEGDLISSPGRAGFAGTIAPAVWIPFEFLDSTKLDQKGSRIFHQTYFELPKGRVLTEKEIENLQKKVKSAELDLDSVDDRKRQTGEAFGNFGSFLNLVGFVSLLLGCIGVAGAVSIYIKDKLPTVAVLRCLGASGQQAFGIYLIQVAAIGLLGAVLGATFGSLLQKALPFVLEGLLPIENITTDFSPRAFAQGTLIGLLIAVLFALLPLAGIFRTSPLRAIRASFDEKGESTSIGLRAGVGFLIAAALFGFAFWQIKSAKTTAIFMLGMTGAFGLLWLLAKGLTLFIRRFFPKKSAYVLRQGLSNLFRPQNQTVMLVVTVGLGTMLLATLFLTQQLLLSRVAFSGAGSQPNMILFDIQKREKDSVAALVRSLGLPILQDVPIVTMRLEAIDDSTKTMETDSLTRRRGWVWDREYRSTYRDSLIETETLLEGEFVGKFDGEGPVPISIDERLAEAGRMKIGSRVRWNVSGVPLETVVRSLRKVDFNRVQTNFMVVFPQNSVEAAPGFGVIVSRVESAEQSAIVQGAIIRRFPSVSAIDLTQILKAVDEVLKKVSFVIRFMALFSILTGLAVLMSSIYLSKFQRIRESVLLRTLGASRRQILQITSVEYFLLGALACLAGIGLSVAAAWGLARFAFEIPFSIDWRPLAWTFFSITGLTVLIGLFNSFEAVRKSPLEVLRQEVG